MALDYKALVDALASHAAALGVFDRVQGHEPKNAPGHGLTCAFWVARIAPQFAASGLNSTTARLDYTARIYNNMLSEPQDDIDPRVLTTTDLLIGAYSADFELGGLVRNVDLLGNEGEPLRAQMGHVTIGGSMYRCSDINIPLIVNDVWSQSA